MPKLSLTRGLSREFGLGRTCYLDKREGGTVVNVQVLTHFFSLGVIAPTVIKVGCILYSIRNSKTSQCTQVCEEATN